MNLLVLPDTPVDVLLPDGQHEITLNIVQMQFCFEKKVQKGILFNVMNISRDKILGCDWL